MNHAALELVESQQENFGFLCNSTPSDVRVYTDSQEMDNHSEAAALLSAIEAVLERYPDVVNEREGDQCLLHTCCFTGDFEIVKMLLEAGADVTKRSSSHSLDYEDNEVIQEEPEPDPLSYEDLYGNYGCISQARFATQAIGENTKINERTADVKGKTSLPESSSHSLDYEDNEVIQEEPEPDPLSYEDLYGNYGCISQARFATQAIGENTKINERTADVKGKTSLPEYTALATPNVCVKCHKNWASVPLRPCGHKVTCEGHDEQFALSILSGVLKTLQSEECDAKDVVVQLQESLQLDRASLEQPKPETKQLIRCLANKAKCANRLDVVRYLRTITPAGTTGPLLPENHPVQNIPCRQRRDLTINLCGGDEWKEVAESLGLTPAEIRYLDNRTINPCDAALAHSGNKYHTSVGNLYDVLVDCKLPQYADFL